MKIDYKNDQDAIEGLYACLLQEIEPIYFIPKQNPKLNDRTVFEFIYISKNEIQDACDALVLLLIAFHAYANDAPSIKAWGGTHKIDHQLATDMFNLWIIKESLFHEIQKAKSVPTAEIKDLLITCLENFCSEDNTILKEQLLPKDSGLLIDESWDTLSWFYESQDHFILLYYDIYALYS